MIHCKYDELVDPNSLKEHPKNRNKHGQDQIERLVFLFEHHGIRHPIICDADNPKVIIVGRGRQLAAIRAGLKEFPVVYQKFESEEQKYSFIQADNAIAFWSELDLLAIKNDIGEMTDFNVDLLGIKNLVLDSQIDDGFSPDDDIEPEKKHRLCPHCGEEL